jgi:hypothetical protein
VDGIFQDNWTANQGLDNPRRALQPTAVLFGDGDQDERREMWVNAIQIREGRLSNAEIEALGGPTATGIPIVIEGVAAPVEPPVLQIARNANGSITLSWTSTAVFVLESKERLTDATWTEVPGVTGNSVTLTPATATAFYRLRQ